MFNEIFEGKFEVYSVVSGEALSEPMTIDETFAEMDKVAVGAGMSDFSNGVVDIRRVQGKG